MKRNRRTPLVFLHGLRGTPEGLQDVLANFNTDKYELYAPALPPFGQSDRLKSYNADTYADYIADFIQCNKLTKPILVGHSMGTIVAAATAAKYPKLLGDKLILLAPITEKPRKSLAVLQPLVVLLPNKPLGWLSTKYLFIPQDRQLYKDALRVTYNCGAEFISRRESRKAATFSAQNCIKDFSWSQETLIIVGDRDKVVPIQITFDFAKTRAADIVVIDNAGHLINYETPSKIAKIIQNWLENQK